MAQQTQSNVSTVSGEASVSSANCGQQPPSWDRDNNNNNSVQQAGVKRKKDLPEMPDPDAEVIVLSPRTLLATNFFVCEICNKGFKRNQNLQLHRRDHNLNPWKLRSKETGEYRCDCGTLFNRRDSFITHRAFCNALAEESARVTVNAQQGDPAEPDKTGQRREGSPPSLISPLMPLFHFEPGKTWLPRVHGSVFHASSPPSAESQTPIELEWRALPSKSSPEPSLLESNMSQFLRTIPTIPKSLKRKAERSPMITFKTRSVSDNLEDGYKWRKFGQKSLKGSNIRHYYKCSHSNCDAKKRVERDVIDTEIVMTTYKGQHNHESSVVPYIVNRQLLEAQQDVLEEDKSGIIDDDIHQMSGPSEKFGVSPPQCTSISSGFADPDAEILDLSTTGLMATNRSAAKSAEFCNKGFQGRQNLQFHTIAHNMLRQRTTQDSIQGEDINVADFTIGNSAASSDNASQLIDQILNTKAEKPDFDLGQLVARIDALLFNYDTQLRTKNTIPKKLPDLPTASEDSSFTGQVSKHVKQSVKQIRLYSGDKHHTSRVLNAIENIHWTAVGFLLLGASLEDVHTINKNEEECLRLFMSMADLSKAILQLQNLPDLKMELDTKLNESIHLIAMGAILSDLQKPQKGFRRC